MPEMEDTSKFIVDSVLYDRDEFSVAIGIWIPNGQHIIAMRWNKGDDEKEYPKTFGNPHWFIISNEIARSILYGLAANPLVKPNEYLNIIEVLRYL